MIELRLPIEGIILGLTKAAAAHPELVMLDADLPNGGAPNFNIHELFPGRTFEMGISEQTMIMTAAGLAASGKIPFAMGLANFVALRGLEQIRTFVAHTKLNVKIITTLGGLSGGKEGPTHIATEDIAHMRAVPDLVVLSPTDAVAAEKAVLAAADWKGPVYISLGRTPTPVIYDDSFVFRIGKAEKQRDGADATIISTGRMLYCALQAAELLEKEGLRVRVLDMQTVKPLDEEAVLAAARETGAIVTVEEHTIVGGLGGAVAEYLSGVRPTPVIRIGINDLYSETGKPEELVVHHGLVPENVARAVHRARELK
jgi:transketolase